MCSRVCVCLIGAVLIYFQVLAAVEDAYIAEMMVESNVTLQADTILSIFDSTPVIQLSDSREVTLSSSELVAECLIVGEDTNCNCSTGYVWSNLACYTYNCCRETPCKQNMSHITPLCVAKMNVLINGVITLNAGTWAASQTATLKSNFEDLNALESLNVTGQREQDTVADFNAVVNIQFLTSTLQTIVNNLETSLGAVLKITSQGLVTILAPEAPVCYKSVPVLKCTFQEETTNASWILSNKYQRFKLNTGSVVKLNFSCTTEEYKSCIGVTLQNVTNIWSGLYECGFTRGSITHIARAHLKVIDLPDQITLKIDPLAVDCIGKQAVDVKVSATISNSTDNFEVWSEYFDEKTYLNNMTDGYNLVYTFSVVVKCQKKLPPEPNEVSVFFKNIKGQKESEKVAIPVIYDGEKFCDEENDIYGDAWPNTPAGDTAINITCAAGKTGFKSRTCDLDGTWQPVFPYCINEVLNKISNGADNFLKGLDATPEMAMNIFAGLKNSSTFESDDTGGYMADINASINVLDLMSRASENFDLQVDVLPDLVKAASNMLNKSWNAVNQSVVHQMSSNYLESVEGLVKNIHVNETSENVLDNQNIELKFCSSSECNVSMFGINVYLNQTNGIVKAIAVKNLMDKLRNNFRQSEPTSLLLSVTLQDNNDSSVQIQQQFPQEKMNYTVPYCVFWDTIKRDWSDVGCFLMPSNGNQTVCKCNHLTSFSVLMAKKDISTKNLDIITWVGLGVSICSLLIFLTVEFLVWSAVVKSNLSHFRHTAIVNIATFLLLADCSFLASAKGIGETWCLALTVCKHLFFLIMFSWMMCLSVMLVHQLIFVFSPLRKRVFMFLSGIVGYVCPILIVGSSYMYCKYTGTDYYNKETCWLVFERLLVGSIHSFLLPIGTVIFTNIFSMVVVVATLVKSSTPEGSKADDKETAKSIIKVVVFLTPVFGLTWIIGFALLLLDEDDFMFTVANYSFNILNSFQGLFLLITGCFAEQKVREAMLKIIMAKTKGKSDSTKNLNSTTHTKNK